MRSPTRRQNFCNAGAEADVGREAGEADGSGFVPLLDERLAARAAARGRRMRRPPLAAHGCADP